MPSQISPTSHPNQPAHLASEPYRQAVSFWSGYSLHPWCRCSYRKHQVEEWEPNYTTSKPPDWCSYSSPLSSRLASSDPTTPTSWTHSIDPSIPCSTWSPPPTLQCCPPCYGWTSYPPFLDGTTPLRIACTSTWVQLFVVWRPYARHHHLHRWHLYHLLQFGSPSTDVVTWLSPLPVLQLPPPTPSLVTDTSPPTTDLLGQYRSPRIGSHLAHQPSYVAPYSLHSTTPNPKTFGYSSPPSSTPSTCWSTPHPGNSQHPTRSCHHYVWWLPTATNPSRSITTSQLHPTEPSSFGGQLFPTTNAPPSPTSHATVYPSTQGCHSWSSYPSHATTPPIVAPTQQDPLPNSMRNQHPPPNWLSKQFGSSTRSSTTLSPSYMPPIPSSTWRAHGRSLFKLYNDNSNAYLYEIITQKILINNLFYLRWWSSLYSYISSRHKHAPIQAIVILVTNLGTA